MKKFLIVLMLVAGLLSGCGIQDVTNAELLDLLEKELGTEISNLEILSSALDGEISEIEAFVAIESSGVRSENELGAVCAYDDSSKAWRLDKLDLDEAAWSYYPLESSVAGGADMIEAYLAQREINFTYNMALPATSDVFRVVLPQSVSLDLAEGSEKIAFSLVAETEDFIGETAVTADVKFQNGAWAITQMGYEPIDMQWKNGCPIVMDPEYLREFYGEFYDTGLRIDREDYHFSLFVEDIESVEIAEELHLVSFEYMTVAAKGIYKGHNKYGEFAVDSMILYRKENGEWIFAGVSFWEE